jgi:hypothetical protein
MPAIQLCAVSGVVRDTTGTAIQGVTVAAYCSRPFIHPTDGSLIIDYRASTTTDSSGAWTLNLIETATPAVSLAVSFSYPLGLNKPTDSQVFTIIVPNQASATFASLANAADITQL